MKKALLILSIFVISTNLFAQSVWNTVWTMQQMPGQDIDKGSEMAIVKAGFDTDGDGWGEFLCAYTDLDPNLIMMYEASANDTYNLVWSWEFPRPANSFAGIAVGDIDNNGIVEIVVGLPMVVSTTAPNPPRVFTFEWNGVSGENNYGRDNGDGTFAPTSESYLNIPDNTDWRPYSMTIDDIDKDGANELIIGVRSGGRGQEVLIASALGGELSAFGSLNTEFNFTNVEGGSNYCTTIGDLDNDGNTDIFEMVWNNFTLRMFEVTGADTYEHVNDLEQIYGGNGNPVDYGSVDGLKVVDINGDGKNELFIAGTEPQNKLFLIQNVTDISAITADDVVEFYTIPVNAGGKFRAMDVADPDQDGNLSLMIAGETNGQIFDLEYKGSGAIEDSSNWELTIAYDVFKDAATDLGADSATALTPRFFYGSSANDMDKDGLNEYVFVNYSNDKGIWANDPYVIVIEADKATSVSKQNTLIPEKLVLEQNYPNPFNPSTTFHFGLNEQANVSLRIYDILGREIATLIRNEVINAGTYEVTFDASVLASGTYIYKLTANNQTISKKMNLIK